MQEYTSAAGCSVLADDSLKYYKVLWVTKFGQKLRSFVGQSSTSLLLNSRIFGNSDKETQPHSLNVNS